MLEKYVGDSSPSPEAESFSLEATKVMLDELFAGATKLTKTLSVDHRCERVRLVASPGLVGEGDYDVALGWISQEDGPGYILAEQHFPFDDERTVIWKFQPDDDKLAVGEIDRANSTRERVVLKSHGDIDDPRREFGSLIMTLHSAHRSDDYESAPPHRRTLFTLECFQ